MNRFTVLADISSRTMHATLGSPKTVAGAVAVDTARLEGLRRELSSLPKWGACDADTAAFAVDLMASQATAVAIVSINRDTDAWRQFLVDADVLHNAIILTSRKVAGWAKPANLLKFILLGSACAAATGHALGADRRLRIVGATGRQIIECNTVCDSEVEGKENLEVFESFWSMQRIPTSRLAKAGFELISNEVRVTTEQLEPGLMLADYAAGVGLAAATENPGTLPMPLEQSVATQLLAKLRKLNKLAVVEEDFDYSYSEIFKDVMDKARELADA
jgi:hypothetical protein